jgi:hypothetical protein
MVRYWDGGLLASLPSLSMKSVYMTEEVTGGLTVSQADYRTASFMPTPWPLESGLTVKK